jgi:hypothetical protein
MAIVDPARVDQDASLIASEVITHHVARDDAKVKVTLEIEVDLPQGASEHLRRTVTENSKTLRFISHGFEAK